MIQFIDGNEVQRRMNELASANKKFIFAIDYKKEKGLVLELDEIDPAEIKYDLQGVANVAPKGDNGNTMPVIEACTPPTLEEYETMFNTVQEGIARGRSSLVNLTARAAITTNLDSLEEVFHRSSAPYRLWVKDHFVCFSPEIFVRVSNGKISSYPMKGTIDATLPNACEILMNDEKEAEEHHFVVDLIKNDLSRVATQVEVTRFRYIDEIVTNRGRLLETSSEITGTLPADYCQHVGDIIFSQLPGGSITGAPKPETMKLIEEAENYDRGFYTGVMGTYANGVLDSAVMIRFIDQENGQWYYKAGGGITHRSDCRHEYEELKQKIYVPVR